MARDQEYNPKTSRRNRLKNKYNLSIEEYEEKYEEQDGRCLICSKSLEVLHVDHCHGCNLVRGLLCHTCNSGLGMFKDDPMLLARAMVYLENMPCDPEEH